MAEYELIREVKNLCPNNQMRDVFFDEVDTADPLGFVRDFLRGKSVEISSEVLPDGSVTVYAAADGLIQSFRFTPI